MSRERSHPPPVAPPPPAPTARTALIIPVPAAEPLVSAWRARHDPAAASGVPAHITLIFPFLPLSRVDDALLADLYRRFARAAPIRFALTGVGSFPTVLYLTPEPAAPFRALIDELTSQYPDAPPYGGAYPTVTPHLTVAHPATAAELAPITAAFAPLAAAALPLAAVATEVWLMAEGGPAWRPYTVFSLGGNPT